MRAALRQSSSASTNRTKMFGSGTRDKKAAQPLAFFGNTNKNASASSSSSSTAKATKTASAPGGTKTTLNSSFGKWRTWSEERTPAPKTTLSDGLAITPALGKAISSVATTAAHAHSKAAPAAAKPAASAKPAAPPPPPPPPGPEASLLADLGTRQLPEGMHALLRSVAQAQLAAWLEAPNGAGGGFSPDAAATKAQATARTTTDISAAVELVAAVVPGDSYPDKHPRAVLSLVACETERSVSWSRLEGLFAHWAVRSGAAGSAWQAAPYGWRSAPALSHDAGGGAAWQSAFERHTVSMGGVGGDAADALPTPIYGLLLEVPVSGSLAAPGSGIVFVLKSGDVNLSASTQNTRWLREQPAGDAKARDFFVEVAKLPKLSRK